jgi:hypothetical protein
VPRGWLLRTKCFSLLGRARKLANKQNKKLSICYTDFVYWANQNGERSDRMYMLNVQLQRSLGERVRPVASLTVLIRLASLLAV